VPAPASLIPEIFGAGYRQHAGKSYAPELTRVSTLDTGDGEGADERYLRY
jgi:hypothetical protein